jgi:hypothetical protein
MINNVTNLLSRAATINIISRWLNYLGYCWSNINDCYLYKTKLISLESNCYLFTCKCNYDSNTFTINLFTKLMAFGLGVFNNNEIACRERNYLFYARTVAAVLYPYWAAFDQYASKHRTASFRHR